MLAALTGCVHLERFSGQATDFNIQVADAQNKTMLLNIVRAANRFPMHFTELSTLSGTGTLTAGGTLTAPAGILNGGMATGSLAPTLSVTETPTFNIAVLETQEFYKGMLKPLTLEQVATYVDEGLQPELLYTLAFGEMVYQKAMTDDPIKLENNFHPLDKTKAGACPGQMIPTAGNAATFSEYSCFRSVLRALLDRHLTVEKLRSVTNLGPLMSAATMSDLQWLRGLDPKIFSIVSVNRDACRETDDQGPADSCPEGLSGLPPEQRDLLERKQALYRVQTESTDYRFCFDEAYQPPHTDSSTWTDLPNRIAQAHIPAEVICRDRLPKRFKEPRESADFRGSTDDKTKLKGRLALNVVLRDSSKGKDAFSLQVEPRSTEGVVYYLGEITRCETGLDKLSVCSQPTVYVPYRNAEDILFAVSRSEVTPPSRDEWDGGKVAVNWGGKRYAVSMDPEAKDRSGQVLRVITQLLALNRSAKDFPTPATVPIISR
jgi:hypothetical protein